MSVSKPSELKPRSLNVPILGFVGYSGSGKTTLLSKLITELSVAGMRIGVIKHAHHRFDIDHPGKDSYALRHAGAKQTLVASKHRWALMVETPDKTDNPQLDELVSHLDPNQLDLIFVEGFKHACFPKLEVHRTAVNSQLLYPTDPDIIALLSDDTSQFKTTAKIPVLNLNDTKNIVQFIKNFIRKLNDQQNQRYTR
jgi:molybdopterin-guanine dinucleotide biosynthesis protein MobB